MNSMRRWRRSSIRPPKYPEIPPTAKPTTKLSKHTDQTDREGNPGAIHHAAEHVPPEAVRAEQEYGSVPGPEQAHGTVELAPQFILRNRVRKNTRDASC